MKLSIIVPVYNVEQYIHQCIYSIVNQTIKDIEILVINDGTLDKSIEIINEFHDDRIKIINQRNGGLSSARNTGIKYATGEYIVFIDSDDYLLREDVLEDMYNQIYEDDADILVGNALAVYDNDTSVKMTRNSRVFTKQIISSEDFLKRFLEAKSMLAPVWLNIYKNSLIKDMRFREGILHEDEEFTPRIFLKAKKISVYPKEFYGYRQRVGSISKAGDMTKNSVDLINTCMELEKKFDCIEDKKLRLLYKDYLVMLMIHAIRIGGNTKISNEIYKFLFANSYSIKNKIKSLMIRCIPQFFVK